MPIFTISTKQGSPVSYPVTIENNEFITVTQRWSDRARSWYFDFKTPEGAVIQRSVKALLNVPLIRRNRSLAFPRGNFYVINSVGSKDTIIGRDNLGVGKTFTMIYSSGEN